VEITAGMTSPSECSLPHMLVEPGMIVTRLGHEPRDIKQGRKENSTNTSKHKQDKQPHQHKQGDRHNYKVKDKAPTTGIGRR
jgi:hypothetical protein